MHNQNWFAVALNFVIAVLGARALYSEIMTYTLRDGKMTEERHFHE